MADRPASKKPDRLAFKRLVVLRNPSSTHAARSAEMTDRLIKLFGRGRTTIIDTEKRYADFQRQLMSRPQLLGPQTLLAVAGGDGTVSQAVNVLLDGDDTKQSTASMQTVIVPLWGGNANDLAHMLNGPVTKADIAEVVGKGTILNLFPMRISYRLPSDGQTKTYLATNYISFGASAAAAKAINRKGHRKSRLHAIPGGRLIREVMTIVNAMVRTPRFRVREDGDTFRVYERAMINGPRFAKVERVAVDLMEPMFSMATVERKRTRSLIYHGLLLANRQHRSDMVTKRVHFTVLDAVTAQIDGESLELPAKTEITIEVSDAPLRVLSYKQ